MFNDRSDRRLFNLLAGTFPDMKAFARSYLAVFVLLLTAIAPQSVASQTLTGSPANPDGFIESFDPYPKTSGSPLVGLSIRDSEELDLEGLNFQLPPYYENDRICVRANTVDGRYSAENPFLLSAAPTPSQPAMVRLKPLTKEHLEQLQAYDADKLAVRIYKSSNEHCHTPKAQLFPSLVLSDSAALWNPDRQKTKPLVLHAQINSRARATEIMVRLKDGNRSSEILSSQCLDINQGSRIAFDKTCELELPAAINGIGELTLIFDDGFDLDKISFPIWLPTFLQNGQ